MPRSMLIANIGSKTDFFNPDCNIRKSVEGKEMEIAEELKSLLRVILLHGANNATALIDSVSLFIELFT